MGAGPQAARMRGKPGIEPVAHAYTGRRPGRRGPVDHELRPAVIDVVVGRDDAHAGRRQDDLKIALRRRLAGPEGPKKTGRTATT